MCETWFCHTCEIHLTLPLNLGVIESMLEYVGPHYLTYLLATCMHIAH